MTRPASPLPRTCARSTSFASAAFLAVGVARGVSCSLLIAGCFAAAAAAGVGGAAGGAGALRLRRFVEHPSTSPTFTSSPSLRSMRLSTPACGALTSRSILSVSSSTSGSPAATASPSLRSHLATRASTMDSPTSGTTMFDGICAELLTVVQAAVASSGSAATATVALDGLAAEGLVDEDLLVDARGARRILRPGWRCAAARRAEPCGRPRLPAGAAGRTPTRPCSPALPAPTRLRRRSGNASIAARRSRIGTG